MSGTLAFGLTLSLIDQFSGPAKAAANAFDRVNSAAQKLANNPPNFAKHIQGLQQVQEQGKRTQEMGEKILKAGGSTLYAGAKMSGAIGDMTGAANSFEKALTMVGTVSPKTFGSAKADMAEVSAAAKGWSTAHSDSAEDYVRTSYMMISAGLQTDQAITGTAIGMSVATATMGKSTDAAALLATMYNNVGDESVDLNKEMTRLGDVVTKTQQTFQFADLNQLNEGFKYALPVGKQFRMELNEVAATIGQLNSAGITGSQAGTAFRASMFKMQDAAKELKFEIARTASGGTDFVGTLENIKKKFGTKLDAPETTNALQKAFGPEGFAAIGVLLGQTEKLRKGIKTVGSGAGSTAEALAMMDATGAGSMDRFANATTNAKVALGTALVPALLPLITLFGSIANRVSAWAAENPRLAGGLGVAAVVITGLTIVVGAMLTGIGMAAMGWGSFQVILASTRLRMVELIPKILATNAALLANPVVWVVAGVVALGLAIYAVVKYWDQIKAGATVAITWMKDGLLFVWTWLKANWPALLPLLLGPFAPLAYAILAIVKYWDQIKGAAALALGWIVGKLQGLWTWINSNWPLLLPLLLGPFAPLGYAVMAVVKNFDAIKETVFAIGRAIADVFGAIVGWIQKIPSLLSGAPGKILEYFAPRQSGVAFAETFAAGIRSGTPAANSAVANLAGGVDQYMPHSDAATGPLSRLSDSGRAFSTTWAGGIDDGAADVNSSVSGLLTNLRVPDINISQSAFVQGASGERQSAAKKAAITIANLVINVTAKDVREAGELGDLLQGLALEAG